MVDTHTDGQLRHCITKSHSDWSWQLCVRKENCELEASGRFQGNPWLETLLRGWSEIEGVGLSGAEASGLTTQNPEFPLDLPRWWP